MKFSKAVWSALTSAFIVLFVTSAAWSQSSETNNPLVCGPRDVAVAELTGDFGEHVIGRGLSGNGQAMLEIYRRNAGTWTVIVTDVNGMSCVLANGTVWVDTQTNKDGYVFVNRKK
jgi:hypothetical protein